MEVALTALLCFTLCLRHCCAMAQCLPRVLQTNQWNSHAIKSPFSFSCVNAVFHSAWQSPQAGKFYWAGLSVKPSQGPVKCCKVLIQLSWVVSSSVPWNYRTVLSLDKNCNHFDTCCQGWKRQQAIAAKMPRSWEVCRVTVLLKAIACVQLPWYQPRLPSHLADPSTFLILKWWETT